MAGAIAWSYDSLSEDEQVVFSQLGVFAGGCTADAATNLCGRDVLGVIGLLVDKNLLRADEGVRGEPRFRMLDTLRAYALERLEAGGELSLATQRHAEWSLALAQRAEPELRGPEQALWMAQLNEEHDNLRAALAWSLDNGQIETALSLGSAVYLFWFTRGYFLEGQHWLERALELAESSSVPAALRAKAMSSAGEMAWGRGDLDRARRCHEASLSLRRHLDDTSGVAQSLHNLGNLAIERGEESTARMLHEEALEFRRRLGSPRDLALSLRNVARLATSRGDTATARELLEEALRLSEDSQHEIGRAEALRLLGDLALRQGQTAYAASLAADGLRLGVDVGAQGVIVNSIEVLASIANAGGRAHHVARLLGAREALRERMRMAARPTEQQYVAPAIAQARSRLGEAEFDTAWQIGRGLSLDEIEELARDLGTAGVGPSAPAPATALSGREQEVVALIAQGLTNRQIAERLIMSERTVHAHVRNILDKLGLASRTQVAAWAVQLQLGRRANLQ